MKSLAALSGIAACFSFLAFFSVVAPATAFDDETENSEEYYPALQQEVQSGNEGENETPLILHEQISEPQEMTDDSQPAQQDDELEDSLKPLNSQSSQPKPVYNYEQPAETYYAVVPQSDYANQEPASQEEAANGELSLQLSRINLLAQSSRYQEAFDLIKQLKRQYPENSQILLAEAQLNFQTGNRGAGFNLLNKASLLDPTNEDIIDRQRAAVITQGPNLEAGYNFRRTSSAFESISHVSGQALINESTSLGINVENNYLRTRRPIIRANGVAKDFSENRQRAELLLNHVFRDGNESSGAIYAANKIFGGGGEYRWWALNGVTTFQGNIYRPYWNFTESVIDRGTRSNILVNRQQFITPDLQLALGGGYNHYELNDVDDAADSITWNFNASYTKPFSLADSLVKNWRAGAYYTIDGEYFTHMESRINAGGVRFNPLPVIDNEIHSFYGSLSRTIATSWLVEGYGGYSVNRLDGFSGPLYGGSINYSPFQQLGLELRGSRTQLGGQNNREQVDQLGVNVKWLW